MNEIEDVKWFAMNAFRGGAINVQSKLIKSGIENFVPKKYGEVKVKGNKIKRQLVAVIPSLIFIKGTFSQIDEICNSTNNLHFIYTKIHGGDKNVPITILNREMERFIDFVDGNEEYISYIEDPSDFDIEEGEKVIITEGPFVGKEATFVRVKNETKRQIVVEIEKMLGAKVPCQFPSRIIKKIKV